MTGEVRVFVLKPGEDWIVDTMAKDFEKKTSHPVVDHPRDADVVWLLGSWCWEQIVSHLPGKVVVCTVHHIVPDKFDPSQFLMRDQFVSLYHVYTQETAEIIRSHTTKPIVLAPHWVDTDRWFPVSRNEARDRLKIPQEAFVVGSFQRDTEGRDLTSPKLEKGPDIFCDLIERVHKSRPTTVLLGGWRREYVIGRLQAAGVPYRFHQRPPQTEVRDMYAACDFYLCTSRIEGGPQCILEASAMRVPIFSTPVGISREILHKSQIIDPTSWMPHVISDDALDYSRSRSVERAVASLVPQYDRFFLTAWSGARS